jgi:hypothetical protein
MHGNIDTSVYLLRLLTLVNSESSEARVLEGEIVLLRKFFELNLELWLFVEHDL